MSHKSFDRRGIRFRPLREREDRVFIEDAHVPPSAEPRALGPEGQRIVEETAERICDARAAGKSRMLVFGAHAIKNGLAPVMIALIERGWITHLATNGAGVIHDWEFAFQGHSSEHVADNVREGKFGAWDETGRYINLAIALGAHAGLGYGESAGALIEEETLTIPAPAALVKEIEDNALRAPGRAAAAADLLALIQDNQLEPGVIDLPHPYKRYSLQAAAYRLRTPFTSHPMFGHDIIYLHPYNQGAAIGRAAERDFLRFAASVAELDGGVYLSVGSAVMSPMVFEKSLSMAQNVALQSGQRITRHFMTVADLQPSHWDWSRGEPPEDNPDYYLRFNKSFSRMGGTLRYLCADNRDFLLALLHTLPAP